MYKRILVPLDGSELAEQALSHAVVQAQQFGAEIVVFKVLGQLPEPSMAGRSVVKTAETLSAELAVEYLDSVVAELCEKGIEAGSATAEGRPYVEIIRYAEENSVDLIVMSTRGYSGLSRWLLGSVTDRVVRGSTVPVLLVQAQNLGGLSLAELVDRGVGG